MIPCQPRLFDLPSHLSQLRLDVGAPEARRRAGAVALAAQMPAVTSPERDFASATSRRAP